MLFPTAYLAFAVLVSAIGISAKGRFTEFFEVLGRNMISVFLVGIGMISVFAPSLSAFVFVWLCFNFLSPVTKGMTYVISVTCELILLVYWCMPP